MKMFETSMSKMEVICNKYNQDFQVRGNGGSKLPVQLVVVFFKNQVLDDSFRNMIEELRQVVESITMDYDSIRVSLSKDI